MTASGQLAVITVSVTLFVAVKAAQPALPIRVSAAVIEGGDVQGSCPSNGVLESARETLKEEIHQLFQNASCGGLGWTQVVSLDLEDPSHQCPSPWNVSSIPTRSCSTSNSDGCHGVSFPASGVTYSHVCGRAIGHGTGGSIDGFGNNNIDNAYLAGISVTYGLPRQHIWSFANGLIFHCPCDNDSIPSPPSFVGDNYFCDGDYNEMLWDGQECTTACCTFNSPPWFSVTLPAPSSDAIEVRICSNGSNEATNLSLLQLFVQ